MAKRRGQKSNCQFDSWPLKFKNRLDSLAYRWRARYHLKALNKTTTSLQILPQLKVCTQSYGSPKLWESQFWEFRDSHLGVSGQNDIWVLVLWLSTKYTIRGMVWLPPSPGHGESCESVFAYAPKMFNLCTNQFVVWFV
jgi:hypothetical protein